MLIHICTGQDPQSAAAFQGRRLHPYRHWAGHEI